jgi:protein-S-isoprenylcysteine O-methyltransferase Ste14
MVRAQLVDLRRRYPSTPFLVLSPLAEGADRLVVRIALEFGASLVVPLPFPREEYEKDFQSPESRVAFARLLEQASRVLEVGLVPGATSGSIRPAGLDRDRQYEAVGSWVARHSQILLALWDGVNLGLTGGTAALVDFKLGRKRDPHMPREKLLDPPEYGPVYHLVTPRQQKPVPDGAMSVIQTIFPPSWGATDDAQRAWADVLERIERFNAEVCSAAPRLAREIAEARRWDAEEEELPAYCRPLLDHYAAAEALARRYQARRLWSLRALFALAVAGVGTFVVYDDAFRDASWARWMLYLYVGIFASGYLIFLTGWRFRFEKNYLDYRALAEGLRVQIHWTLAGVDAHAADHYLRKQRTELDWILAAMRNCCLPLTADAGQTSVRGISDVRRVRVVWVHTQEEYFERAWRRKERAQSRVEWSATALVATALAASLLLALTHDRVAEHVWIHNSFTIGIVVLLAVAGALKGYAEKHAIAEESKQYHRMKGFFRRAEEYLGPLINEGGLEEARAVLFEVGKEALRENGDWVLMHRARPMDVPAGG